MSKSLLQRWFGRADNEQLQAEAQVQKSAGDVRLGQGDHAAAETHYLAAIAAAPRFAPAHTNLAFALHGQGRSGEAAQALRLSNAINDAQADAHYLSAVLATSAGRLEDAERHYRRALDIEPALEAASIELCALLAQQRRLADALQVAEGGLAHHPGSTQLHFYMGNLRYELGQVEAAIVSFRIALSADPASAALLNNFGQALIKLNDPARAGETLAVHEQLVQLVPGSADAHNHLGLARQRSGDHAGACADFERALALAPGMAQAHVNLGTALFTLGQTGQAIAQYRLALASTPAFADAHFQLGSALQHMQRTAEAEESYRAALSSKPDHVQALNNLAVMLQGREQFAESIALLDKAMHIDAKIASVHHNMAVSIEALGRRAAVAEKLTRFEQAIAHYEQAIALDPRHVESLLGIAAIKIDLMQLEELLPLYERIFSVAPTLPKARCNHGVALLTLGRFAEGWRDFEYRWELSPKMVRLESAQPHWQAGIDPAGKTLLLYAEQGLGDTLQFVRYAKLLAQRGATVWIKVPPSLTLLLASCPGVSRVFAPDEEIPPFDYLCPMLSVPGIVGTDLDNIPGDTPYLKPAPERVAHWRDKLGEHKHFRVGLVWAGEPRRDQPEVALIDRMRSLHFDQLRPLLDVPGVEFHSVQVGQAAAAQLTDAPQVIDHTGDLFDFQETAALAEQLDLAICADTSTAHLVGAIGKPVWLLNRYNTCWRWLRDRKDSPWYPGMRLFRQPSLGDWDSVIAEVKTALEAEMRAQPPR
jgi:tetratricopeptide (TPR) repeat protein